MRASLLCLVAPLLATNVITHDLTDTQKNHIARSIPMVQHCQSHYLDDDTKVTVAKRHIEELKRAKEHHGLGHVQVPKKSDHRFSMPRSSNDVLRSSDQFLKELDEVSFTEVFGDSNICVLTPEDDVSPLYVGQQHIRSDLRDGQIGVPLHLEIQVVDQKTCKPVPDAYIDFWTCNATGVYSGILDFPMNGNPNDRTLIDKKHGRGIQPTSIDGIAHFIINVPSHYPGRATHMHLAVHHDVNVFRNGTIKGDHVSHIGQIYMEQGLLHTIENIYPYSTNKGPWTQNAEDAHFLHVATSGDPIIRYVLLSRNVAQGMYGWIRIAVDMDAHRKMINYTKPKAKREVVDIPGESQIETDGEPMLKDGKKKPLALPLPQALPKIYMYGASFMPQDLNSQPEDSNGIMEKHLIHNAAMKNLQDQKAKSIERKKMPKEKEIVPENHLEIQPKLEA